MSECMIIAYLLGLQVFRLYAVLINVLLMN